MNQPRPSLRFDHREIAVIFSLFIFTSLLMFTVGILVGKGLSQAKYEAAKNPSTTVAEHTEQTGEHGEHGEGAAHPTTHAAIGTSVSTDHPHDAPPKVTEADVQRVVDEAKEELHAKAAAETGGAHPAEGEAKAGEEKPLELKPLHPPVGDSYVTSYQEPKRTKEAEALLSNPRIRSLVEGAPETGKKTKSKRQLAATGPISAPPESSSQGSYTVQVGSYLAEKDAADRVDTLKKLGFPHAHFSANKLGENGDTWYRVWLGYFKDFESARRGGVFLEQRGEVKNYLVRKADSSG